mmetsp:Transcript_11596/g.46901  ORF Transcript_11596/g.46901 Transcript_11596/m.46901 type:complete len:81 (-) Transcript_11596:1397-1639(-)
MSQVFQDFSYAYPSGEIAHLRADLGLSWAEIRTILLDAVELGFAWRAPDGTSSKAAFLADFAQDLDAAFAKHGITFPTSE